MSCLLVMARLPPTLAETWLAAITAPLSDVSPPLWMLTVCPLTWVLVKVWSLACEWPCPALKLVVAPMPALELTTKPALVDEKFVVWSNVLVFCEASNVMSLSALRAVVPFASIWLPCMERWLDSGVPAAVIWISPPAKTLLALPVSAW